MAAMRQLLLLRHAKSSRDGAGIDDVDRPLAPRGQRAAAAIAGHMVDAGLIPALVMCSSARRARETWQRAAGAFDGAITTRFDDRLYLASPGTLLAVIGEADDAASPLLVVGHNPGMAVLAGAFARVDADPPSRANLARGFATAALAIVESAAPRWRDLARDGGRLAGFVRPRELPELAKQEARR